MEADTGQVTEDTTYHFSNMMVRSYQGCMYFLMSKQVGSIMRSDVDIGEVANNNHSEVDTTVHTAEVAAVITIESYARAMLIS